MDTIKKGLSKVAKQNSPELMTGEAGLDVETIIINGPPPSGEKFSKPRYAKITPDLRKEFLLLLDQGATFTRACQALNVSTSYMHEYIAHHPNFKRKVDAARKAKDVAVEDALWLSAIGGNVTAQIFYLVNRTRFLSRNDPDRWLNTRTIEVNGPEGGHVRFDDMTPEEKRIKLNEMIAKRQEIEARTKDLPKLDDLLKSEQANDKTCNCGKSGCKATQKEANIKK